MESPDMPGVSSCPSDLYSAYLPFCALQTQAMTLKTLTALLAYLGKHFNTSPETSPST